MYGPSDTEPKIEVEGDLDFTDINTATTTDLKLVEKTAAVG